MRRVLPRREVLQHVLGEHVRARCRRVRDSGVLEERVLLVREGHSISGISVVVSAGTRERALGEHLFLTIGGGFQLWVGFELVWLHLCFQSQFISVVNKYSKMIPKVTSTWLQIGGRWMSKSLDFA